MSKKQSKKATKPKEEKPKEEKQWVSVPATAFKNESEQEEMDGLGVTFKQAMRILSRPEKEN
jgi:hypothetical protein